MVDYARMESGSPDWVMCGMPRLSGGVWLLASKDMTYAELNVAQDWERAEVFWDDPRHPLVIPPVAVSRTITLTAGVKTFVMIAADDYPAAFRALFEQWAPGPGDRAAIGGLPQIEASR